MDYKPKQPNALVAAQKGTPDVDAAVQAAVEGMISAGTLPTGRHHNYSEGLGLVRLTRQGFEDENYKGRIWFDVADNVWRFERVSKTDPTDVIRTSGKTREDAIDALKIVDTLSERQINELREAYEHETGDFGEDDPEAHEVWKWFGTPHGQEYQDIGCRATWEMMQNEMARYGFKRITVYALDTAYCSIVDNPDNSKNFDRFFAKRDRLAQEAERKSAVFTVTGNPSANPPQESDQRKLEDAANRRLPLSELRRKAIFETKGGRVPSTGTGRIF
jgi:hypothetical protein